MAVEVKGSVRWWFREKEKDFFERTELKNLLKVGKLC